ncbi:putative helicase MOV-10 [Rhincodon typus]|uniref:putative helicase MOV-10 n=1 Tax=Rhincodon typus TaxID=259920 RepID=UPI00202F044D|nr:putative helicase MOV-10 [Rhincodon typus]
MMKQSHLLPSGAYSDHRCSQLLEAMLKVVPTNLYQHHFNLSRFVNDFINNMKFNIFFTFNRLPLRLQHRAAQLAKYTNLKDVLFPTYSDEQCIHPLEKSLAFYDRSLEENPEQVAAVHCIVSGISRPAPYLVFGPPGTGKTVTIVEAIKQVLRCIPTAHILACAPTNSATDLLCQKLQKHVEKRHIYRLNAVSRNWDTIPQDVQTSVISWCCDQLVSVSVSWSLTSEFSCRLFRYSVHLSQDRSNFPQSPIQTPFHIPVAPPPAEFSCRFEIGSLFHMETVTPPVILESHPSILRIPNELFYDNELKAEADTLISHSYCQWQHLPKKNFPVIFHGLLGEDQREEKSPSFFNLDEIDQVLNYLKKLLTNQGKKGFAKISPKEIGVITPYRKQVEKIREAINRVDKVLKVMDNIRELKVGSVEEFQGQERKVIIISTVRSCSDYLQMDEDFNLGFLKNPKRFNVALTRAKALLIVVGNPIILSKDRNWNSFLNYCVNNECYTGYNYASDDLESDLVEGLEKLGLDPDPAADPDTLSIIQQQLEPEWRSEV